MRKFLTSVSIRTKIASAFAVVLICTAGLGVFSILRLDGVNSTATEIRTQWLPATRELGEIAYHTMRFRQLEASHALAADPATKAGEGKKLAEVGADAGRAMAVEHGLARPGLDAQQFAKMAELWSDYLKQDSAFLALSKSGDTAAASAMYRGEMRVTFNKFQDILNAEIALSGGGANKAAAHGAELGESARLLILTVLAVVALLCLAIGLALVRGVSTPVSAMTRAMSRLAEQDLDVDIPCVGRGDEIGAMAGAMQVFKDNALHTRALERQQRETEQARAEEEARIRRAAEDAAITEQQALVVGSFGAALKRLTDGDLIYQVTEPLPPAYEPLRGDFNSAIATLRETMRVITANAGVIRSGTEEITLASDNLSKRTEQQAANLEETAAALDEITATVKRTAEGAADARKVVAGTKDDAERCSQVVRTAIDAMGQIETSSQQITQIIGVIDEIAFQTNLLALNAGVEAARAGDAGRGFAVVAQEVRALAQRSAEAAKEIKTLISTSSQQVGQGVELVRATGEALERIAEQVSRINEVMQEIAASAQEQATGLHQINLAVNQMDQVTQQNAAMVEESTAAARSLADETDDLTRLIGRFQVGHEVHAATSHISPPHASARSPVAHVRAKLVRAFNAGGA